MSCTYYIHKKCIHCDNEQYEEIAISSGGKTTFLINDYNIKKYFIGYLKNNNDFIYDEYQKKIDATKIIEWEKSHNQ